MPSQSKSYLDFLNLAGYLEIDYFFSMEMSDMKPWTTACPGSTPRVTEMRELGCVLVLFCVSFLCKLRSMDYGEYSLNWRVISFQFE